MNKAAEVIPPNVKSHAELLAELEWLANLMDSRFTIPGTNIRFGLDPLLGFFPGIGDTIGVLASAYIVHRAHQFNVPHSIKLRMALNIFIDWLVGLPPIIGDLFDIGWKANRKNLALIRTHLEKSGYTGKDYTPYSRHFQ